MKSRVRVSYGGTIPLEQFSNVKFEVTVEEQCEAEEFDSIYEKLLEYTKEKFEEEKAICLGQI